MDPISYWTGAMEAGPEDLTTTTSDLMKRAGSATNGPDDQFEPPTTSEETQQENAAGTERGAMSGDMDNVTPDDGTGGEDMGMGMDDGMGGMDDGMGGGDIGMDDGMGGGDAYGGGGGGFGGEDENPFKGKPDRARAVYRLYVTLEQFSRVLDSTSESLTNYVAPTTSQELRDLYNHCCLYIEECRQQLRQLMETDFTPDNYSMKRRRYIAIRHVYSGVVDILTLHFRMLQTENKTTKS